MNAEEKKKKQRPVSKFMKGFQNYASPKGSWAEERTGSVSNKPRNISISNENLNKS